MRKKILFVILPIFFLACNFLMPQLDENPPPASPEAGSDQQTLSTPQAFDSSTAAIRHCPHRQIKRRL